MSKKYQDLTGLPFGYYTAIRQDGCDSHGVPYWLCRCRCGNEKRVLVYNLLSGNTKSCGCLQRERVTTHGLTIDHKRLLGSITKHIESIRSPYAQDHNNYKHLRIPAKYLGVSGAARFVREVIRRYPEKAEEYESNKSLEVDKDISGEPIFAPWNIRFVTRKENINNRRSTLRLDDGTSFADFCTSIGIETCVGRKVTQKYGRIESVWRKSHKIHPELMQALRDDTDNQSRLLEITKLKIRHAELMIAGLKELLASKQTA